MNQPSTENQEQQSTKTVLPSFTSEMFTALAHYVSMPKPWHSEGHKVKRVQVRDCIARLILAKKQTMNASYENHLNAIAEMCEIHLYDRAESYESYADPKTLVRRIKELLVHLVIKAKTAAGNNAVQSTPKLNNSVPTENNTIVIDDDSNEAEDNRMTKDSASVASVKSPDGRTNAYSRVFILRVLRKVNEQLVKDPPTIPLLTYPKETIEQWLHDTYVECVTAPPDLIKHEYTAYGGVMFDPHQANTYWKDGSQFGYWWKNNIERKQKVKALLEESCYVGHEVSRLQRANWCRAVLIAVNNIRDIFGQEIFTAESIMSPTPAQNTNPQVTSNRPTQHHQSHQHQSSQQQQQHQQHHHSSSQDHTNTRRDVSNRDPILKASIADYRKFISHPIALGGTTISGHQTNTNNMNTNTTGTNHNNKNTNEISPFGNARTPQEILAAMMNCSSSSDVSQMLQSLSSMNATNTSMNNNTSNNTNNNTNNANNSSMNHMNTMMNSMNNPMMMNNQFLPNMLPYMTFPNNMNMNGVGGFNNPNANTMLPGTMPSFPNMNNNTTNNNNNMNTAMMNLNGLFNMSQQGSMNSSMNGLPPSMGSIGSMGNGFDLMNLSSIASTFSGPNNSLSGINSNPYGSQSFPSTLTTNPSLPSVSSTVPSINAPTTITGMLPPTSTLQTAPTLIDPILPATTSISTVITAGNNNTATYPISSTLKTTTMLPTIADTMNHPPGESSRKRSHEEDIIIDLPSVSPKTQVVCAEEAISIPTITPSIPSLTPNKQEQPDAKSVDLKRRSIIRSHKCAITDPVIAKIDFVSPATTTTRTAVAMEIAEEKHSSVNTGPSLAAETTSSSTSSSKSSKKKELHTLEKLYNILQDETNKDFCAWEEEGTCFKITNVMNFEEVILGLQFPDMDMAYFQHELFTYGFQLKSRPLPPSSNASSTTKRKMYSVYMHPLFQRDHIESLTELVALHSPTTEEQQSPPVDEEEIGMSRVSTVTSETAGDVLGVPVPSTNESSSLQHPVVSMDVEQVITREITEESTASTTSIVPSPFVPTTSVTNLPTTSSEQSVIVPSTTAATTIAATITTPTPPATVNTNSQQAVLPQPTGFENMLPSFLPNFMSSMLTPNPFQPTPPPMFPSFFPSLGGGNGFDPSSLAVMSMMGYNPYLNNLNTMNMNNQFLASMNNMNMNGLNNNTTGFDYVNNNNNNNNNTGSNINTINNNNYAQNLFSMMNGLNPYSMPPYPLSMPFGLQVPIPPPPVLSNTNTMYAANHTNANSSNTNASNDASILLPNLSSFTPTSMTLLGNNNNHPHHANHTGGSGSGILPSVPSSLSGLPYPSTSLLPPLPSSSNTTSSNTYHNYHNNTTGNTNQYSHATSNNHNSNRTSSTNSVVATRQYPDSLTSSFFKLPTHLPISNSSALLKRQQEIAAATAATYSNTTNAINNQTIRATKRTNEDSSRNLPTTAVMNATMTTSSRKRSTGRSNSNTIATAATALATTNTPKVPSSDDDELASLGEDEFEEIVQKSKAINNPASLQNIPTNILSHQLIRDLIVNTNAAVVAASTVSSSSKKGKGNSSSSNKRRRTSSRNGKAAAAREEDEEEEEDNIILEEEDGEEDEVIVEEVIEGGDEDEEEEDQVEGGNNSTKRSKRKAATAESGKSNVAAATIATTVVEEEDEETLKEEEIDHIDLREPKVRRLYINITRNSEGKLIDGAEATIDITATSTTGEKLTKPNEKMGTTSKGTSELDDETNSLQSVTVSQSSDSSKSVDCLYGSFHGKVFPSVHTLQLGFDTSNLDYGHTTTTSSSTGIVRVAGSTFEKVTSRVGEEYQAEIPGLLSKRQIQQDQKHYQAMVEYLPPVITTQVLLPHSGKTLSTSSSTSASTTSGVILTTRSREPPSKDSISTTTTPVKSIKDAKGIETEGPYKYLLWDPEELSNTEIKRIVQQTMDNAKLLWCPVRGSIHRVKLSYAQNSNKFRLCTILDVINLNPAHHHSHGMSKTSTTPINASKPSFNHKDVNTSSLIQVYDGEEEHMIPIGDVHAPQMHEEDQLLYHIHLQDYQHKKGREEFLNSFYNTTSFYMNWNTSDVRKFVNAVKRYGDNVRKIWLLCFKDPALPPTNNPTSSSSSSNTTTSSSSTLSTGNPYFTSSSTLSASLAATTSTVPYTGNTNGYKSLKEVLDFFFHTYTMIEQGDSKKLINLFTRAEYASRGYPSGIVTGSGRESRNTNNHTNSTAEQHGKETGEEDSRSEDSSTAPTPTLTATTITGGGVATSITSTSSTRRVSTGSMKESSKESKESSKEGSSAKESSSSSNKRHRHSTGGSSGTTTNTTMVDSEEEKEYSVKESSSSRKRSSSTPSEMLEMILPARRPKQARSLRPKITASEGHFGYLTIDSSHLITARTTRRQSGTDEDLLTNTNTSSTNNTGTNTSASTSASSILQPMKVCLCKEEIDEEKKYIRCYIGRPEGCNGWIHLKCIHMLKCTDKKLRTLTEYICPACEDTVERKVVSSGGRGRGEKEDSEEEE